MTVSYKSGIFIPLLPIMSPLMYRAIPSTRSLLNRICSSNLRKISTTPQAKPEGDISSVFVSLSGTEATPLPQRFANLKRELTLGREEKLQKGWERLLIRIREEVETIHRAGSSIIPSIAFKDIAKPPSSFNAALRKRGVAVIRGVVPEHEARNYKTEIEAYIRANPSTKGR